MITANEKHLIDTLVTHGKNNKIKEKQTLLAVGLYAKSVGATDCLIDYLARNPKCKTDEMFKCIDNFCKENKINTN